MKKNFINPEMNISLFNKENVITTSNLDNAKDAISNTVNTHNITETKFEDLQFIL